MLWKPARREHRRQSRKSAARPAEKPAKTTPAKVQSSPKRSRFIGKPLRDRVMQRAGYQCEYQGPEGVRCPSRHGLEIDHKKAFSKGGEHNIANLQVLCKPHNLKKCADEFGRIGPPPPKS